MKIEKFRNGYRIRQQYNGKRYSVVVPYKPTQKEALKLITEKMDKPTELQIPTSKSVEEYIGKYIAYCEKINSSPSTIRGYESIKRVYCKIKLPKVAKQKWTLLQVQIGQSCKGCI